MMLTAPAETVVATPMMKARKMTMAIIAISTISKQAKRRSINASAVAMKSPPTAAIAILLPKERDLTNPPKARQARRQEKTRLREVPPGNMVGQVSCGPTPASTFKRQQTWSDRVK